jgi:hypothetical protein
VSSPEATSDHFDLLPFISILMCVLGCLLLVTISMSAISLGVGAAEAWTPVGIAAGGTGDPARPSAKEPIVVEWDGKAATFQLQKRIVVPWKAANPTGIPAFQAALRIAAAKRDSSYLLVAVRPSGFATLAPLLDELRGSGLEVGYEPVEQARSVTLASVKPPAAKASAAPNAKTPAKEETSTEADEPDDDLPPAKDEAPSDDAPPSKP